MTVAATTEGTGGNRVLGDPSVRPSQRPHRVAMSQWYIDQAPSLDPRVGTIEGLFSWMQEQGYDGCEISSECFQKKYFYGASLLEAARRTREAADKYGMRVFGCLYHSLAWQWEDEAAYMEWLESHFEADRILGAEYVTYQVFLSDKYMGCGSDYTDDGAYMAECARQVEVLRARTHAAGFNFYLETHVDRITQDPRAVCMLLDSVDVELNGDLAHYITLGIRGGRSFERTMAAVSHIHARMARVYGDLSVGPEDPERDWLDRGVTWSFFNYARPAMRGGLTSRVIVEETGPAFEVADAIGAGARLVPLMRALAAWCDNEAAGRPNPALDTPGCLNPWRVGAGRGDAAPRLLR